MAAKIMLVLVQQPIPYSNFNYKLDLINPGYMPNAFKP